jgi:gliding motility-associated-like protein
MTRPIPAKRITLLLILTGILFSTVTHAQGWLWAHGNSGGGMDGWPCAVDPAGNVFAAGITFNNNPVAFGTVSVPNIGVGIYQSIIVKYDPNGTVQWANGTTNGDSYLMGITTDKNGNSFMFGTINSPSLQIGAITLTNPISPKSQYFIAKYDPSGNVLWAVNAGNAPGTVSVTTISYVMGTGGIATDANGNVYITTSFKVPSVTIGTYTLTNADPSGSTQDVLIAKYDPSGNLVWAKSAGGTGDDQAFGITATDAGDVYIAGEFQSPSIAFGPSVITTAGAAQSAFIARYNASGTPVWAAASGGASGANAVGIASDDANNVYITGGFKDNSISFSGTSITNPTPGQAVLYLTKFAPSNNVSWSRTINSQQGSPRGGIWGYSIAMSKCGVIWVSGIMYDSVFIEGHVLHAPGLSNDPIFIAGYDAGGTYVGSGALQSGGDDQNGIACDAAGNVYMCSDYALDPFIVNGDTVGVDSGGEMMFVAKFASLNSDSVSYHHSFSTVCSSNDLVLAAPDCYTSYLWNDGHTGSSYSVQDSGLYWVYGSKNCKSVTYDSFLVSAVCDCDKALFLPNAFTPNGDGQDDVFYPRSGGGISQISSFRIYNRWGELLFERGKIPPNDVSNAWDGSYKGAAALPEVYVWIVDAVCENGKKINKKGSITVIK